MLQKTVSSALLVTLMFIDLADIDRVPRCVAKDIILDRFKLTLTEREKRAVVQKCAMEKIKFTNSLNVQKLRANRRNVFRHSHQQPAQNDTLGAQMIASKKFSSNQMMLTPKISTQDVDVPSKQWQNPATAARGQAKMPQILMQASTRRVLNQPRQPTAKASTLTTRFDSNN